MFDFKQNLQRIYNALRSEGYTDIGSVDDFSKSMQDEGNREKVFNALHRSGYTDIGKDFKTFSGMIYEAPKSKPAVQPAVEKPAAKADPVHVDASVNTEVAAQPKQHAQKPAQQQQQSFQPTVKIPTFQETMEQNVWQPTPLFESEVSIDKDGNRVTTAKPQPTFSKEKGIAASPVYRDVLTGKEYAVDDTDEKTQEQIKKGLTNTNRTASYDNVETLGNDQKNREQVAGLMQNIDAQLQNAYKVAQEKHADAKPSMWQDILHDMADASHGTPFRSDNAYETLVKNDTDVRALSAAKNSLKDAQALINEADKSVKEGNFDGFFKGAGRGFGNKFFDARTWDMGLADSQDAGAILKALGDFDQGKKLTPAQQALLDAKAVELATNAYFGSYIGRGYKAGGVTAESIPFMIEMLINPASGVGQSAQSTLTRYALKRFGKQVVKNNAKKYMAAKVGARVLGDIAGAATMAATTGSIHTLADAEQRMAGDVQFDTNDEGYSVFAGHTEGDDVGTAFAKAFANTTIENYSEMFGEYFAPVLKPITRKVGGAISRGMEKVGLSSVNDFISHVGASDVAKIVTDFEKHAKWNGVFGEYAEEVAGNIMNAAIVGDMTMDNVEGTGVFNLNQNIDTFLGVSLMGGFMSSVKAAGYRTPKYRQRQAMTAADDAASITFGNQDTWGSIRNIVGFGSDQERHDKLVEVLTSGDYTQAQKQAAMQYAKEVEAYKGMLQAEQKRRSDEKSNPLQTDAETSFDNGYSLASAQEMNDAKNMLDYRTQKMQDAFGISEGDIATVLGEDPVAAIDAMRETHSLEQVKAATDYLNAKATWDGMITHVQEDIEDKTSKANAEIDARVNKTTGMVQPATMKYKDRKVYVVGGNIQMFDDGSMVDEANSDESVIIRDAETGKIEMVSPADIFKVEQAIDPVEEKERAQQEIRESVAQEAANNIDGTLAYGVNDTYTILDDDGQQHNVTIVQATDENGQPIELSQGQVAVSIDGTEPTIMPADAIQQGADQYNLARLQQHEQQQVEAEAAIAEQEHEATRPVYELNDEVTLRDDNGLPVRGSITASENEDGLIEVWTESPIGGNRVNMFTRDQLDGMLMQQNGVEVEQLVSAETTEETTEEGAQSVSELQEEDNNGAENIPENGNIEGNSIPQRAIDRIPTVQAEDGKTVHRWEQAEPADTYDALNETYGDEKRTSKKVGKRIDNLDKQIKTVQKQIDKLDDSDDFDADMSNEDGYQQLAQQKAALEAQKKYWQSVQRVPQDRRNEANKLDEEARKKAQAEREAREAAEAEQARIDRERTEGVPDMVSDKPADARTRGFRNVNGQVVERQNPTEGVTGRESNVKFSDKDTVKGRIKVIEASQLQPSHVNGATNVQHFIPEAQPKNRTDQVSNVRAGEIAANINPEEITGDGSAYQFSAPTTNTRGEVIQGNNRGDALRRMWSDAANAQSQQAYKQYLIDHADEFGLDAQAIAAMQQPVMVNEIDVDDNEAIRLGQLKSSNNESGGLERIDPVTASRTLGSKMANYANVLLGSSDEEASLSELIAINSGNAIVWLANNGIITPTQVQSAYDAKGNITEEAKIDLKNILKQSLFQGGVSDLHAMFDAMPVKAQKAILTTFMRDFDSTDDNRILGEIQQAIEVWYHAAHTVPEFAAAKNYEQARALIEGYKRQTILLDNNLPADLYSPFSFELASRMQALNMKTLQQYFNDYFDLVQGKSMGDLFNEGAAGEFVPMVEAIKRVFNVDFTTNNSENNDQERSTNVGDNAAQSEDGRQGEQEDAQSGEQNAPVEEPAETGRGTESNTGEEVAAPPILADPVEEIMNDDGGNSMRYNVEAINKQGNAAGQQEEQQTQATLEEVEQKPAPEKPKKKPAKKTEAKKTEDKYLVSDERMEQLRARMRRKLNQLNMGVDPELVAIGTEMAVYHIERGARKFADYAKVMIEDIGNAVRPYLKAFYNAVRDMPEAEQYADEMTPYDEVRQFNVATIGENGEEKQPTVVETAEQVSNEQTVQRNADEVEVVVSETENTTENTAYSITPAEYKTKRGKVLDMFLVKPNDELGTSEQREANARAREMKGWWDKNTRGFMLRSEEDARQFAEQTFSNPIGSTSSADEVQAAREATNTNPTEAQKEAGNYAKGHIKVDGYDIVLENPKGSTRSGKDANGKAWSITMNYDYGYLSRTEGVDGDHIDVYLSDNPASGNVYVIDQINQSNGSFDEHKVMYGFPSIEAAREAYASQYEDGWKIGPITEVSREEFKKWVYSSKRKTKPFAEYKNVKKTAGQNEQANEPKQEQTAKTSLMSDAGSSRDEQEVNAAEGKTFKSKKGLILYVDHIDNGRVFYEITDIDGTTERYDTSIPAMADALQRWEEVTVTDNNNNNETDRTAAEQAAANTEAIASEAETTASEAETIAETATTEREVNEAEQAINDKSDEVESQLALLGYYEGEEVAKDYNEAYGNLRNAEKKAVADAFQLAKKIAKYLGLITPKKKNVRSNIAPIGGDVHFSLPLDGTHNLYFNFKLDRDEDNYDNLKLKGVMFRVENTDTNVRDRNHNNFLPTRATFEDMMKEVRRALKYAAPEFVVPEKSEEDGQNTDNEEGNKKKISKPKKKAVTSGQETQTNLFGELFGSAEVNDNENENENDAAEPRSNEAEGNTNRTVGDVPADGNGILEPESTGATDGGNSDAAGTGNERLADREPQGLSTDGSRGGSTERNNVAGEEQSNGTDGGRSIPTGDTANGRNATGETSTGSRQTKRDSDRRVDDGSKKTANERNNPKNTRNYLYGKDAEEIDNMSEKQRLATNVEALETLVQVLREKRDATAEERAIMGKFRGWGGVDLTRFYSQRQLLSSNAHSSQYNPETDRYEAVVDNYQRLGKVLNELDPDEKRGIFKDIRHASLTSYYTPLPIARAMNDYLVQAGYKGGGNLLDPSMGTGIFEGTLPKDVQQRTNIYGVELDWLTAQLAKQLYPDAHVENNGFEKAKLTAGAYDIVESNIPFGQFRVNDPSWEHDSSPVRKAAMGRIHTYFAVKMMEMAKAGGLVTIMTSNAIMDTKGNAIIRKELLRQGEFLGAIRLPNNVFKGAGTAVVTDVIFMRKYRNEEDSAMTNANPSYKERVEQFNSSAAMTATNKAMDVPVNGYFAANPNMMIGDVVAGGQYREDEFGLTSKEDANAIAKKMTSLIKKQIVGDRVGNLYDTTKPEREVQQAIREAYIGDGNYNSAGNIVEQNGKYGVLNVVGRDGSLMFEEKTEQKKNSARIKMYIPVRTAFKKLTAAQINREDEVTIKQYRKELNDTYKAFVDKYGRLNDKANNFIEADIDSYQMRGLEDIDGDTGEVKLADIFTKNTIKPTIDMTNANTPSAAIATCLAGYGEIRPAFMEKTLGEDWREQCHGTLFRLPNSDSYVVADDYLSGDVKTKLEEAKAAAAMDEAYKENVEALEKVQPRDLVIGDINIRMGARWVSDKTYTDFLREMFGMPDWGSQKSQVRYIPEADEFLIEVDRRELGGEADRWATGRKSAKEIFEAAMKDKTIQVWDHHRDGSVTLNREETQLANDKVQELRETFETWVGSDPERGEQLASEYNDKFNRIVIRKWNGDFLDPVGLQGKTLRQHQKAAVWMLLNNRGGIVDHIVGAGKTLVMQSAIMEMRRMGIAKKPMILALKATCSQIAKEFSQAYPSARILAPTEKDFSAKNRKKLLAKIASNDYDCVIISHEQYTQLPHTQEVETQTINEQLEQLDAAIMLMRGTEDKSQLTKRQLKGLEKRKANLEAKMQKMLDRKVDREFCFENLGVDYLFVDECQQFKGLPYATTYNQVAGLGDPQGSQRAVALLNGVRYLQQLHQGDRGTVFLSGTTITNTLVEVYNLLNYLRPNIMKKLGYSTFDAWAAQYAVKSADLEYGVTNELKTKTRFRSFQNVSELGKLYAEIADVRNDMNLGLPKPKPNSHLVKVTATHLQEEINREVVAMVQQKNGDYFGITSEDDRKVPWSLHASRISEMSAIDPRLIFPDAEDEGGGKVPVVCESVAKLYKQFDEDKGTQLIFCDKGIPDSKKGYDVYTDIITRLTKEHGIPRSEIADIHEANTDQKREALFKKVNEGTVRILIGGTKNMGTGVNVQSRLIAEHHLDMPWTPADREQREGRAVRQGNRLAKEKNGNKVELFYYATEGSLDMYKYQLQEIKGKMFAQFKTNTIDTDAAREFDEGSDAEGSIDPAEMVAILSGNPVIFEKSKQDKLVKKLRRQEAAEHSDFIRRKKNYEKAREQKNNFERLQRLNNEDVKTLEQEGFVKEEGGTYPNAFTLHTTPWEEGETFEKAADAGKRIHELVKEGKDFTLKGYGVTAKVKGDTEGGDLFSRKLVVDNIGNRLYNGSDSQIKYSVSLSDNNQAAGLAFRSLLERIIKNKDAYQRGIDEANRKLRGSEKMGEYQFSKQKELEEAIAKKKELDAEYQKLSDDTKETPESESGKTQDNNRYRLREPQQRQEGAVTDAQIEELNEQIARRSDNEPQHVADAATKMGKSFGVKVRAVEDVRELTDKNAKKQRRMRMAKGWYDTETGEIVVVVPNAESIADVEATVLHEVVGHEGLRKVVGDQHFDNFLRKVYERSDRKTREKINALAAKNSWNFAEATEEYIAQMAETGFDARENQTMWERVKQLFKDMLSAAKVAVGININDNDLRYMLWRSYQMQKSRGAMGVAEDVMMQQKLGVGNHRNTEKRFRDGSLPTDDLNDVVRGLRGEYDAAMKKSGFQIQEAIQDSMLSLKKLMDILQKHSGKKEIADWENAYTAENALSSRNKAEQDEFQRKHYKPLMEALRGLVKEGMTEKEVGDYVMTKHGIERNREMSVRAALTDSDGKLDKALLENWNQRKDYVRNDASLPTWEEKQRELDSIAEYEFGAALYDRDYSGLTDLYRTDDVRDAVDFAYRVVTDTETNYDTRKLGEALKKANAATLEKLFSSGMINRATKESMEQMYDYYVPLRGFDETTAEEVYAYVRDERQSFNNPLKRVHGRSSKADNPFAHILSMADSAILQGNKNLMKQKFLNFVLNRPSDLVSVSDMWIEYDPIADEWHTKFPAIPVDVAPEEVADIVHQFNEDMEAAAQKPNPTVKRIKGKTADVPYRTLHNQLNAHQVIVKRDGKEYVLTINANPRAAMALNGQTNPHADYKGVGGAFKRSADYVNRHLAGFYTTKNPDFVASNFVRDAIYSNSMVWVKESPRYAMRFHKNFVKFNPKKMGVLFHKFNHGTLDMSDPVEKEFYRFMMNGGETGYSNLKDIEELKKQLTKDLKNTKLHQMKAFLDRLEIINRAVENCARFAAYMSSREEGRSVQRSVFDAKEISVNFNKKGAGGTFFGAVGQTKAGNMAAASSAACRALYVFFNAGVQGTTNIVRAAKNNKGKFTTLAACYFILGYLAPLLMGGGGDGDDEDEDNTKYEDLPDYVRRTNIIIKSPFGKSYIALPLPIEFRTMYGMGELANNVLSGKERYTGGQLARTMGEQVTQALPINFLEGEGTGMLSPFVPSVVAPLWQAHENKDWTGMPIYKDSEYNKKKPEWTKAYGRTNRHLVDVAEWLNKTTGGDEFTKGKLDLNPALIESVIQGYFGGAVTFLNKMSNSVDMATGDMEADWRNVPIANRLMKSGNAGTKQRAINREYFNHLDQWEEINQREKGYLSKLQSPKTPLVERAEWGTKLNELHRSEEWKNMQMFNFLNKQIKKMGEIQKAMPEENPELARDIWHLKMQANEVARGEWDD